MNKPFLLVVIMVAGLRLSQGFHSGLFESYMYGGRSVAHIGIHQGRFVFKNRDEFPYMAGLECMRRNICGATIVQKNAVLTAASCLAKCDIPYLTVTAGGIFVAHSGVGQTNKVRNVKVHPEFITNPGHYNDIAIVWTKSHFLFGPTIRPIKLAEPTSGNFLGEDVVILGWGLTELQKQSLILTKGTMTIVQQHYCPNIYGKDDLDRTLCALDIYRTVTPCIGDIGGPLVVHNVQNPHEDVLIGLVSFAGTNYGNCNPNIASTFIRIGAFHEWVTTTLQQEPLQKKIRLRPTNPGPSSIRYVDVNNVQ